MRHGSLLSSVFEGRMKWQEGEEAKNELHHPGVYSHRVAGLCRAEGNV